MAGARPSALDAPVAQPRPSRPRSGFRGDIEGLRAIAVLMVMLAHANVPFLAGGYVGVDVFFVISGFLITGRLRREIEATGKISLRRFYAARVERIMPAAVVALYAFLLILVTFLPRNRWQSNSLDIMSAGGYFVNWRLAERSVDYFAASDPPSIVQHFWSLAVEEQFYIFWPLLFLGAVAVWRWVGQPGVALRRRVTATLAVVAFASLLWSIIATSAQPQSAYFSTLTRVWELALGVVLTLVIEDLLPLVRKPAVIAWIGLGAIVVAGVFYDAATPFPGFAALMPTLGAVLLILAGADRSAYEAPLKWLDTKVMRTVGGWSYSLYLWHWPILVLFSAYLGRLPALLGVVVVGLSFLPAWLSYKYVETPIRRRAWLRRSPANAMTLSLACAVLVGGPAYLLGVTAEPSVPRAHTALFDIHNGSMVLGESPRGDVNGYPVDKVSALTPDPTDAVADLPDVDRDKCFAGNDESRPLSCVYGDQNSPFTVALIGDSHAVQWVPALRAIAEASHWKLVVYGKSACPFVDVTVAIQPSGKPYNGCAQWNGAVRSALADLKPRVVFTTNYRFGVLESGKQLTGQANSQARIAAMRDSWSRLTADGAAVVILRDTPHAPVDVPDCAATHRDRLTSCAFDRVTALEGVGSDQEAAVVGLTGVHLIDLNDAICPVDRCAPVIGGVFIYRDADHLTATYSLSLAPRLLTALKDQGILAATPTRS